MRVDGLAITGQPKSCLIDRITVDPTVCGGRPCVRGLRIRLKDSLDLLAAGLERDSDRSLHGACADPADKDLE